MSEVEDKKRFILWNRRRDGELRYPDENSDGAIGRISLQMDNRVNLVGMFCTRCATVSTKLVLPSINPNAMLVCSICGQQSEDWNELDFPAEIDQPEVIEKPAPQVERPSQQAVNHEPEHARRITELERRVAVMGEEQNLSSVHDGKLKSEIDSLVMQIDALAEDHEEGAKQVRDINTRVRGLETSSVYNESPLNRITRLENDRKVLVDRMEGLKETFDGAYTNAMSKVEELEWAFEMLKKQDLASCDRAAHDEVLNRLRDLEQQFGVMQDQAVEFDRQTANQIDRIDSHAQGLEQEVWKKLEALDKRVEKLDDQIAVPATVAETVTTAAADAHKLIYSLFLEQFPKVTSEDYSLMAHAVGADNVPPFKRNYFSASPSSANDERWAYLCEEGLAVITREPVEGMFPDRLYAVTREGIAFVLAWKAVKRPPTD